MKKLICVSLCVLIALSLFGCQSSELPDLKDTEVISSDVPTSSITNTSSEIRENANITSRTKTSSKTSSNQENTQSIVSNITENVVKEEPIPYTSDIAKPQEANKIEQKFEINTNHTPLARDKYYQYSLLSDIQKQVYNEIVDAIEQTKNIINIKSYNIPKDDSLVIIQKVLADHPEYFYVSRSTKASYNPDTGNASALFIYYTDGETVDTLDENNKMIVTANRENIANQIKNLSQKTEEILKTIPTDCSDAQKERLIHDYIVSTTVYDNSTVITNYDFGEALPHTLNIYGALCLNKAVCEGYSKAFSYFCHKVGINATTVTGTAKGGRHMWNAVQIENDWYMIDLTWDDADGKNLILYSYYNITTEELSKDHIISTNISYPTCTATKHSFKNSNALNVENGTLPLNYKEIIDKAVKNNEDRLYLFFGKSIITNQFLVDCFYADSSPVQTYIKEKNYNICLKMSYTILGEYMYIEIIKQNS